MFNMIYTKKFTINTIEEISRILGDVITGSQISSFLVNCQIVEQKTLSLTKWRRLNASFLEAQESRNNASSICTCIELIMSPVRFRNQEDQFKNVLDELNVVLAFEGLEIGIDAKLKIRQKAQTLSEAQIRAKSLHDELVKRKAHPTIMTFCKEEMLADNYFHAVFEAVKSIATRIREMTGLSEDGAKLFEKALSTNLPILMINGLRTESEKAEQKGFISLLTGVYGTFRNPLSHESKIHWEIKESDAFDMMSTVSYIHRRLDNTIRTGIKST